MDVGSPVGTPYELRPSILPVPSIDLGADPFQEPKSAVLGWRTWYFDGLRLKDDAGDVHGWPPCHTHGFGLVQAYRTRNQLPVRMKKNEVHGLVSLWGRILVCDGGWIGTEAYPYSLIVRARDGIAHHLRRAYLVDVDEV